MTIPAKALHYPTLAERAALSERRLSESGVLRRAARSALYRRAWGDRLDQLASAASYRELCALPYVSGRDLRAVQMETDPSEWACCDHVRLWISTSGTTGTPKWVPISDKDIEELEARTLGDAAIMGTFKPGQRGLALNAPAPYYSDLQGYASSAAAIRHSRQGEMVVVSFVEAERSLGFALRHRADGFMAFPSIAMALAEGITARLPQVVNQLLPGKSWLARPLVFVLQRVVHAKPRHFARFRWGVFGGEPLEPYRQAIHDAWGMESFEIYALSELRLVFFECFAHEGLHLWLDRCLPEIIPQAELEREEREAGYQPVAQPVWEAGEGLVGELVLTSFSDALPLIRYRTSDLVQVVSNARCRCGRTDPRIRVLHRSDDIVNLGIVRFSLLAVGEQLGAVRHWGRVADWQLRVGREGYKAKLTVVVRGEGVIDPKGLAAEVRQALEDIPALKAGLANQLVAEPEVRIDEDLVGKRTSSGKLRRLIYEE